MKDETNIEKLATLSRLYISLEEQKSLKSDIDSILSYIKQIQDISADETLETSPKVGNLYNVMREDTEPHETGIYTEELLNEAPLVKNNYIEVKKIIDQDNQRDK
ncbi:MAG TPA: aspartyl/glutamyl-tRNA amidotransferase subunit C [Candidatus Kaiserbacteria bacterium]|nr:aspartyl/glutamyl-tRNA amidotransferase subunit C [Candidatus Kaiserbacteria bacterium]